LVLIGLASVNALHLCPVSCTVAENYRILASIGVQEIEVAYSTAPPFVLLLQIV
jgi:hypothetical protein